MPSAAEKLQRINEQSSSVESDEVRMLEHFRDRVENDVLSGGSQASDELAGIPPYRSIKDSGFRLREGAMGPQEQDLDAVAQAIKDENQDLPDELKLILESNVMALQEASMLQLEKTCVIDPVPLVQYRLFLQQCRTYAPKIKHYDYGDKWINLMESAGPHFRDHQTRRALQEISLFTPPADLKEGTGSTPLELLADIYDGLHRRGNEDLDYNQATQDEMRVALDLVELYKDYPRGFVALDRAVQKGPENSLLTGFWQQHFMAMAYEARRAQLDHNDASEEEVLRTLGKLSHTAYDSQMDDSIFLARLAAYDRQAVLDLSEKVDELYDLNPTMRERGVISRKDHQMWSDVSQITRRSLFEEVLRSGWWKPGDKRPLPDKVIPYFSQSSGRLKTARQLYAITQADIDERRMDVVNSLVENLDIKFDVLLTLEKKS